MRRDADHGGALDRMQAAFPDAPGAWIDLSTGINPWPYRGWSLRADAYDHLPLRAAYSTCRNALADLLNAARDTVCLSPGSELLIRMLPIWLAPRRVAVLSPTYGDHAAVWRRAGCEVIESPDPLAMTDQVDLIALCNPNNPDGRTFAPEILLATREALAKKGGWLIVDEAYCDLAPELSLASYGGQEGLIILRSFGKFYGLAGLRLGALIAPQSLIDHVSQHLGVWPVSNAALDIGAAAYRDGNWQEEMRAQLRAGRLMLDRVLEANNLAVRGGTDLFRYVEVETADRAWRHLARAGIYVRRFEAQPGRLRIGIPADEIAMARLNEALSLLT